MLELARGGQGAAREASAGGCWGDPQREDVMGGLTWSSTSPFVMQEMGGDKGSLFSVPQPSASPPSLSSLIHVCILPASQGHFFIITNIILSLENLDLYQPQSTNLHSVVFTHCAFL